MPYSIFFDGGYAIHGSYEISHLGRPASHGCIRLHPENAAVLFELVKAHVNDTQIVVTGERPEPQARTRPRAEPRHRAEARTRRHHARTVAREPDMSRAQEAPSAPPPFPFFFLGRR
jgi:hypothetical protein